MRTGRSASPVQFTLTLGLVVLGFGAGCGAHDDRARHPVLRVAAASDLQAVLPVLIERFGGGERRVEVVPVFGSSGQLARQIEAGAPFDVFLSANKDFVDKLAATKAVDPASVRPYAIGTLVLAVGRGVKVPVGNLSDLTRPEVKVVAIADPETAPYGAAARQALRKAGLWETLVPKLAIASTVRQTLQFVETGNAEAGLVSQSIADVPGVRLVDVDPALYEPIVQALGVVGRSSHRREAEAFAQLILGEEGRGVLRSHGFTLPGGP